MKKFLKENGVLVLAFVLPIIFVVVVALSVYLPAHTVSTNYNFVYATCSEGGGHYPYRCDNYIGKRFSVVQGKLLENSVDPKQDSDDDGVPDVDENYTVHFFFHDTGTNQSREIPLEQVEELTLSGLLTSPDGVAVVYDYNNGSEFFFLLDGGSSQGYYLTKGESKEKLNLMRINDRYYYERDTQFLGWVLPGRNEIKK